MSNIQTGAERMPHDLSHLGFLAGQIGRLITISTTPVIAGDSFEMDAVGALRLSPLRRGLAIDSTVDIFTFYVIISNDGSNKLNRSRKARVSYKVQRTINASLNAATSTRAVSSNPNFVTRQKIEIIFG